MTNTVKIPLIDFVRKYDLRRKKGQLNDFIFAADGSPISFSDQAAIVTHYIKLQHSGKFSEAHEKMAKEILEYWEQLLVTKSA